MRTLLYIFTCLIIINSAISAQETDGKNFKQLDSEWRKEESSPSNEFRTRDRQWLKSDSENKGWRIDDSFFRENDSKSDNEWRKRDAAWLKEDSR